MAKVMQLDDSNFYDVTKDKIIFVKFFAPWVSFNSYSLSGYINKFTM
jgi:hypothetical protein